MRRPRRRTWHRCMSVSNEIWYIKWEPRSVCLSRVITSVSYVPPYTHVSACGAGLPLTLLGLTLCFRVDALDVNRSEALERWGVSILNRVGLLWVWRGNGNGRKRILRVSIFMVTFKALNLLRIDFINNIGLMYSVRIWMECMQWSNKWPFYSTPIIYV